MSRIFRDEQGQAVQVIKPGTIQKVTIGAASAASAAFGSKTTLVRIATDTACYILFGSAPTAAAGTSIYMPAGRVEYFEVVAGEKVAVIQASAGGTLCITEAV